MVAVRETLITSFQNLNASEFVSDYSSSSMLSTSVNTFLPCLEIITIPSTTSKKNIIVNRLKKMIS